MTEYCYEMDYRINRSRFEALWYTRPALDDDQYNGHMRTFRFRNIKYKTERLRCVLIEIGR